MTDEPKTPQETPTAGSACSAGLGAFYVCSPVCGPEPGVTWESLDEMCDHGARLFRMGHKDANCLEFRLMGNEVSYIHDYMHRNYPDIPFRTNAPKGST